MAPWLQKVVTVAVGVGVGAIAVLVFKGTSLYEPALLAAGALLGLPVDPKAIIDKLSGRPPPAGE